MRTFSMLAIFLVLATLLTFPVQASVLPVARKAAQEVVEHLVSKGGAKAGRELAEFGGEQAVRQVMQRAAQEGGEALVRQTSQLVRVHGVAALRAVEHAPGLMVRGLNALPTNMVNQGIAAINHNPALIRQLMTQYGDDALRVAARHPGVGQSVAGSLGREGISTALSLQTPQVIQLGRVAPALQQVPNAQRSQILDMIAKAPENILGLLERHPRVLYTAAGVSVILAYRESLMGGSELVQTPDGTWQMMDKSGIVERSVAQVLDVSVIRYGIMLVLGILSLYLLFRSAISLYSNWKLAKLRERDLEMKPSADQPAPRAADPVPDRPVTVTEERA